MRWGSFIYSATVWLLVLNTSAALAGSKVPIPTPRPDRDVTTWPTESVTPTPPASLFSGRKLALEDAVFLALRNNRTLKSAYIERASQKFGLRVAEDRFNPQLGLTGDVSHQSLGGSDATVVDVSPTVSLLTKTGATLDFAWNTTAKSQYSADSVSSAAQVSVSQPLLRGAGLDVNVAPVEQARLGELVNKLRLKTTVSETIANVIVAHRSLLAAQQQLQIAQGSVDRSQDLLAINNALIAAGRMAPMEAVQTEADVESQKLAVLQARQNLETARLALLDLLALDLGTKIVAVETIDPQRAITNVSKLLSIALSQRQDFLGQTYVIEQTRLGMTVAKNEQLWDVSLYATARLGSQYNEGAGSDRIADLTAGLKFTIPIRDLARQQELIDADTTYQDAQLQLEVIRSGIEMQIRGSASQVDLLWQQLDVAERSRTFALQAVTVEKAKLNAGRSTTFQVRSLEGNFRDSENQLLSARIGYLNALTQLDLQLGTTLATWHIELKD